METIIVLVAMICNITIQIVGSLIYFKRGRLTVGLLGIALTVPLLTVTNFQAVLANGKSPAWPAGLALALYALSTLLFLWSAISARHAMLKLAFTPDAPQFIVKRGPYKWVRHPFYSSYLLYWGAPLLLCPYSLVVWGAFCLMGSIYMIAAIMEERRFAMSEIGSIYRDYAGQTGRFLPPIRSLVGK